jgi:DNA-binding response OmpR family regulator
LVEEDVEASFDLSQALEETVPQCRILQAHSVFEGKLLLGTYDIACSVIDNELPDGAGFELVYEIDRQEIHTQTILFAEAPSARLKQRSAALGIAQLLPKPIRPNRLARAARACLCNDQPSETGQFAASLGSLSAEEVIQLKCLTGATCRLHFQTSERNSGSLFLRHGDIVHASVGRGRERALTTGLPAVYEILSWLGGTVEQTRAPALPERTIDEPWQSLLLEAARRYDEATNSGLPLSSDQIPSPISESWVPDPNSDYEAAAAV